MKYNKKREFFSDCSHKASIIIKDVNVSDISYVTFNWTWIHRRYLIIKKEQSSHLRISYSSCGIRQKKTTWQIVEFAQPDRAGGRVRINCRTNGTNPYSSQSIRNSASLLIYIGVGLARLTRTNSKSNLSIAARERHDCQCYLGSEI